MKPPVVWLFLFGIAALGGAAVDRWRLAKPMPKVVSSTPRGLLESSQAPMTSPLPESARVSLDRFNTAALWHALAKEFAGKDIPAIRQALEETLAQSPPNEGEEWSHPALSRIDALVELLTRRAPEAVTDILVAHPQRASLDVLLRAFHAHWKKDPAKAKSLAARLPGHLSNDLAWLEKPSQQNGPTPPMDGRPMESWDLPDPLTETEACLAALLALPAAQRQAKIKGLFRSSANSPLADFGSLLQSQPEIAAKFVELLPPGVNERGNEVRDVADGLAKSDPAQALRWLESLNDLESTQWAIPSVLRTYAEQDPQAAASWLRGKAGDQRTTMAASVVATRWAETDPQAVMDCAKELADEKLRSTALNSGAAIWARVDLPSALAFVRGQAPGPERDGLLGAALSGFGQEDFSSAWNEVRSAEGQDRQIMLKGLLAWVSPRWNDDLSTLREAFTEYAHGNPPKPNNFSQEPITNQFANALAQRDASQALAWAQELPPGEARASAFNGIFVQWANAEPLAASEALATLPAGADRDTAIEAAFHGLVERDPERTFQWALAMQPSQKQEELIQQAWHRWPAPYDEKVQALENTPNIPPATRERMIAELPRTTH